MERNLKVELEALKQALQNEIDSYEFYQEVQEKFANPITKKTFHYLAAQEIIHMEKIKEFDKELSEHFENMDVDSKFNTEQVKDSAVLLFGKNKEEFKQQITGEDELEPYKVALDIENTGFRYYKQAAEATDNYNLKKFFTFLMKEEEIHHALIQNTMNYIQDPENYYADEEDWMFEG